jgi:hypothetical protein
VIAGVTIILGALVVAYAVSPWALLAIVIGLGALFAKS